MLKIYNAGATNINISVDSESYTLYPQYKLYIKNEKLSMIDNLSEIVQYPELTLVLDDLKGIGNELSILMPYYKDHSHIVDESFQIFGVIPNIGIADNHDCAIKPSRVGNSTPINYNHLHEKPQINGVTLMGGNNDARDLNLVKFEPTSSGGLRQGGSGLSDYNFTESDRAKLNLVSAEALENVNQINLKVNKETWIHTGSSGEAEILDKVLSERDFTDLDEKKLDSLPKAGDSTYRYTTLRDLLEGTEYRDNGVKFYKTVDLTGTVYDVIDDFGNAILGKGYQVGQRLEWYPYGIDGSSDSVCFTPMIATVVSVSANESNKLTSIKVIEPGLFNTNANTIRLVNKNRYGDSQFTATLLTTDKEIAVYYGKVDKKNLDRSLVENIGSKVLEHEDGKKEFVIATDRINVIDNTDDETYVSLPVVGSGIEGANVDADEIGLISGADVNVIRSVDDRISNLEATTGDLSGVTVKLSEDGECLFKAGRSSTEITFTAPVYNIKDGTEAGNIKIEVPEASSTNAGLLSSSNKILLDNLNNGSIQLSPESNNTLYTVSETKGNKKGLFSTTRLVVEGTGIETQRLDPNSEIWTKINDPLPINTIHPETTVTNISQDAGNSITVSKRTWSDYSDNAIEISLPTYTSATNSPITIIDGTLDSGNVGTINLSIDSDNTSLSVVDSKLSIGRATDTHFGAIKSSSDKYKISVSEDGTAQLNGISTITANKILISNNDGDITTENSISGLDLFTLNGLSSLVGSSLKDYLNNKVTGIEYQLGKRVKEIQFVSFDGSLNDSGVINLKVILGDDSESLLKLTINSAYKNDDNKNYYTGLLSKTDKEHLDQLWGLGIGNAINNSITISDVENSITKDVSYELNANKLTIHTTEYTKDLNNPRGYTVGNIDTDILLPIISSSDSVLSTSSDTGRVVVSSNIALNTTLTDTDSPIIKLIGKDNADLGIAEFSNGFKLENSKISLRPSTGLSLEDDGRIKINVASSDSIGGIKSSDIKNNILVSADGVATVSGLLDYQNEITNKISDLDNKKLDKQFNLINGDFANKIVITDNTGIITTARVDNRYLQYIDKLDGLYQNVQDTLDDLENKKIDKAKGLVTGAKVVESTENITIELTSTITDDGEEEKLEDLILPNAHWIKGGENGTVYFPGLMSAYDKNKVDLYPPSGFSFDYSTSGVTLKQLLDNKVDLNQFPVNAQKRIVTNLYKVVNPDSIDIKYDYVRLEGTQYLNGNDVVLTIPSVTSGGLSDDDFGVIKVSEYKDIINRTPPALPEDAGVGQYVLVAVKNDVGVPTFEWRPIQF